jgi:phosphate starvation-inducible protein PhoH and related proteins
VTDTDLTRVITLTEAGVAQAVFGPLHRHLAHIQEAFRDPNAPRGAPAYRVTLDAQGDRLTVRANSEADLERVQRIIDSLTDLARRKSKVRWSNDAAAIGRPHAAHAASSALRRSAARREH